jgi:hypothetical protein
MCGMMGVDNLLHVSGVVVQVKKKKAQKGQFAPLKEEVDVNRKFDQYK